MENNFSSLFDLVCIGNKKTVDILLGMPVDILIFYMNEDLKLHKSNRLNSANYSEFAKTLNNTNSFVSLIPSFPFVNDFYSQF